MLRERVGVPKGMWGIDERPVVRRGRGRGWSNALASPILRARASRSDPGRQGAAGRAGRRYPRELFPPWPESL